jgi:hypothetical protein
MNLSIVPVAHADVVALMKSIDRVVLNPIIFFLFAAAMVYFLYGVAQYFLSPGNEEIRKKSKTQMIWGIIGLFVMVAVFGIMQIILNTWGAKNVVIQSNGDYTVNNVQLNANGTPIVSSTPQYTVVGTNRTTYQLVATSLGSWDAQANKPALASGTAPKDSSGNTMTTDGYYIVSVAGTTVLDGVSSWSVGDEAYFSIKNSKWTKTVQSNVVNGTTALTYAEPPSDAQLATDNITPAIDGRVYGSTNVCWAQSLYAKDTTEYAASADVQALARSNYVAFIKSATALTDPTLIDAKYPPSKYPVPLATETFFSKTDNEYYVWWGAVGPVGDGTMSNCDIKVTGEPLASTSNTSSVLKPTQYATPPADLYPDPPAGLTYTVSPFVDQDYSAAGNTNLCWREAAYAQAPDEYGASDQVMKKVRADYVSYANNYITKAHPFVNSSYPLTIANQIYYDKVNKIYYAWLGVVGPVGDGRESDCSVAIFEPTNQSTKPSSLIGQYPSDINFYRAVDSGVSPIMSTARSIAITNALIDIAHAKGLTSIQGIPYQILKETYFPPTATDGTGSSTLTGGGGQTSLQAPVANPNNNYDYWVAIESPK